VEDAQGDDLVIDDVSARRQIIAAGTHDLLAVLRTGTQ
jgi:hypothetical protein